MGQRTEDQLTTDIESTRQDLSRDLDALTTKVSPSQIMERRRAAARNKLGAVRDKVMGSAGYARGSASSAGSGITSAASGATGTVTASAQSTVNVLEERTEGNPLAAGMIAFGTGWLISSMLPASEKEMQAAQQVVHLAKEHGQPLVDEAKSVGQDVGETLKETATHAAEQVQDSAQAAAQNVKVDAQASADSVKREAQGSSE